MVATTKEPGIFDIGEDADNPTMQVKRTEGGVTFQISGLTSIDLTVAEWKALVNSMGYHGGPANKSA